MTDIQEIPEVSVNIIAEDTDKRDKMRIYRTALKRERTAKAREEGTYVCYTELQKQHIYTWRANNLEKRKEYERELYAKNIEARRAKGRAHYALNKLKEKALKESESHPLIKA